MFVQSWSDKFGVSTNLKSQRAKTQSEILSAVLKLPRYREVLVTSYEFRQPVRIMVLCRLFLFV